MADAISEGGIYCCIDKPWVDADLLLLVRLALDHKKIL